MSWQRRQPAGSRPAIGSWWSCPWWPAWPDDGEAAVTIAGTRFTFADDNAEIREVLKAAKEKVSRGQARVGGSAFAKVLDDGRGWSRK